MINIDDEVLRAEQMALAVASTPNLCASEAKEMLSASIVKKTSPPRRELLNKLNSGDEEVRRAHEMAMAVAALGSTTEKGGVRMKAEDIRMAVADVMCDPEENIKKKKKKNRTNGQQQHQKKSSIDATSNQQKSNRNERSELKNLQQPFLNKIEDLLQPPWILRDQNLVALVVLANLSIIYVTLSSVPSYTKLSNTMFIFNMSVIVLFATAKKNLEPNIADSGENPTIGIDSTREDEKKRQQEHLVDEMEEQLESETKIILEWLSDVHFSDEDLTSLLKLQPDSTHAERRRFLKARKGVVKAASAQLGSYIQWRYKNKIDEFFPSTFTTDEADWELAARGAQEIANTSTTPASHRKLPRIVSVYGGDEEFVTCRNGARVVHVFPCQLDTTIAPATTYALALAMYLDRQLDRNHTEKVTVVIDIRSGKGWPNPSSVSLVPFIKLVVGSLNSYFPERLSRCILFPLPTTATLLFNRAKSYLDPDTATKIQVCSGAGSINSAVPEKVKSFIDTKSLSIMERRRTSFFVT